MESTPTKILSRATLTLIKPIFFNTSKYFVRSVRGDLFILPTILQDSNHLHNLKYLTELLATISNKQFRETGQIKSLTCMLHRETLLDTGVGREGKGLLYRVVQGNRLGTLLFKGPKFWSRKNVQKEATF